MRVFVIKMYRAEENEGDYQRELEAEARGAAGPRCKFSLF
jgi:hypothetical protein